MVGCCGFWLSGLGACLVSFVKFGRFGFVWFYVVMMVVLCGDSVVFGEFLGGAWLCD